MQQKHFKETLGKTKAISKAPVVTLFNCKGRKPSCKKHFPPNATTGNEIYGFLFKEIIILSFFITKRVIFKN